MIPTEQASVDLSAVLSSLAGRRVRIGEIIAALNVGRSTYYEQRDEGRLVTADNLLRVAAEMALNPVELLMRCGLVDEAAVITCAKKVSGGTRRMARTRRFQRRPDAPPL